ncbi:MAG TPA: DUF1015 domain-containing protein [Candidatus Hydrogenedentes bacterium]|jgi:uncharacterized protein (DUF1015 family)|nr:DUF1015 domain-containing protein [Candidatus Hydrogenedentota bacterium]
MVDVCPFRGFLFDPVLTGTLDAVLTPPYDVIDPGQRMALAASSPYNMTHVMLPVADGGLSSHAHAASLLDAWMAAGTLKRDAAPYIYLLRQRFTSLDGESLERKAFFALLRLPESGEQFILGHERTFDSPIADRLALMHATAGNIEPIFLMYSDPALELTRTLFAPLTQETPTLVARTMDGVVQELWRSPCPEALRHHLQDQVLYIADGHHRFKTACLYRDERRAADNSRASCAEHEYIMAAFVAFEEPGLKIYAAHRVLPASFPLSFDEVKTRLSPYFKVAPLPAGQVCAAGLASLPEDKCQMIVYDRQTGGWLITLDESRRRELLDTNRGHAWCDLDVAVLHRGILDRLLDFQDSTRLYYEKDDRIALDLVDREEGALALLVRPTRSEQVRACAEAFEPMPQKSTYFFPKMPSGAVMNLFER